MKIIVMIYPSLNASIINSSITFNAFLSYGYIPQAQKGNKKSHFALNAFADNCAVDCY